MKSPQDMRIIQIDITNACMYQCSNCTRFCGHHKKNFFMDFDTFKRAVDSMKGYHGTIGVMGGEPTLHPEFERFVSYLHSQLPEGVRKDHLSLIAPQKDFIEGILNENMVNSEVYEYTTGARETVVGAGLWTAMVPTYKKYYELIQDVFKIQAVNDHGNVMYHSPILINRKDLGIPDEEWVKIRDHCWAQDCWSATITPKGAFFCEIAGALDMLFDGPGGWPIEEGWWRRTPDQFGDQLRWCELCGIALETFTRDANDWIDDVSESMYKRLEEIGSPKLLKPDRINRVKIENGIIAEDSKKGALDVRKEQFFDNFSARFNDDKSILYAKELSAIVEVGEREEEVLQWLSRYAKDFVKLYLIGMKEMNLSAYPNAEFVQADDTWGHGFAKALRKCEELRGILYMDSLLDINEAVLDEYKRTILNPGTLHITDLSKGSTDLVAGTQTKGIVALFHRIATSMRCIGMDGLSNAKNMLKIADAWTPEKVLPFSSEVIEDLSYLRIQSGKKYAVYGAGKVGETAVRDVAAQGAEVVFVVDSDPKKWGCSLDDKEICAPKMLIERRGEYEQILVASTFYHEIKLTLKELGFAENKDFHLYE